MDGRTRLSSLPFPTVSVLTIYSAAPLPPGPPTASDVDPDKAEKDDEETVEMDKVVYWYSQQEELSVERKARLMGTIRGMADFARSVERETKGVSLQGQTADQAVGVRDAGC